MAINLTNAAAERINELKRKRQTPEHFLRLGVRGGGCSGLSYVLDFVETPEPKDKIFDLNGVKVVVDRKSYLFVNGTEIDYKKGLIDRWNQPTAKGRKAKVKVIKTNVKQEDLISVTKALRKGDAETTALVAQEFLSLIHISEPTRPY